MIVVIGGCFLSISFESYENLKKIKISGIILVEKIRKEVIM